MKIHQIRHVIFETISHFSRKNSSVFFSAQTLHTFYKSSTSWCKFLDFALLTLELTKFFISFFKQKFFFSKLGSFLNVRQFFCKCLAKTLYSIDKSSTSKYKFSDLPLLALKFTKFLMMFLEPRVSFRTKSQFFFKLCITLQCHETYLETWDVCTFWSKYL